MNCRLWIVSVCLLYGQQLEDRPMVVDLDTRACPWPRKNLIGSRADQSSRQFVKEDVCQGPSRPVQDQDMPRNRRAEVSRGGVTMGRRPNSAPSSSCRSQTIPIRRAKKYAGTLANVLRGPPRASHDCWHHLGQGATPSAPHGAGRSWAGIIMLLASSNRDASKPDFQPWSVVHCRHVPVPGAWS